MILAVNLQFISNRFHHLRLVQENNQQIQHAFQIKLMKIHPKSNEAHQLKRVEKFHHQDNVHVNALRISNIQQKTMIPRNAEN